MNRIDACPICSSSVSVAKRGATAPFLARRIWDRPPFEVELASCAACGFLFYNPRLEPGEESRLYASYRDDRYQRQRHSCEPWYTKALNASLSDPALMEQRKQALREILTQHVDVPIGNVLDFGGADGSLVHQLLSGAQAYVYDVSEVTPLEGIRRCATPSDCLDHEFQLIICSNVLEHVAVPPDVLAQIHDLAVPGTLVFIEVPFESPLDSVTLRKRLIQQGLVFATRPRVGLSLLRLNWLYLMHEHVNFFDSSSLRELMSTSDWNVRASGTYGVGTGLLRMTMGYCLAQLEPATAAGSAQPSRSFSSGADVRRHP